MSKPTRTTHTNAQGYQEVTPAYRNQRALLLDEQKEGSTKTHIVCPMVDAARRTEAYGQKTLSGLEGEDLAAWANALGVNPVAMKSIAYSSGKPVSIPINILKGSFKDNAINGGFIHDLKNEVHTGIYKDEKFSQEGFEAFVYALYPTLKGTPITREWLYTEKGADLYFEERHLKQVLQFNENQSVQKHTGLGPKMSAFEMKDLLLGVLGQEITKDGQKTQAILVRDVYDLYQYGFLTVTVEDKLVAADLLEL